MQCFSVVWILQVVVLYVFYQTSRKQLVIVVVRYEYQLVRNDEFKSRAYRLHSFDKLVLVIY